MRLNELQKLNNLLLEDMQEYHGQAKTFPQNEDGQWRLFRSLVNVRQPGKISEGFLTAQDTFLQRVIKAKGITDWRNLKSVEPGVYLWQGDITTLKVDAIVNAANSGMTGCYYPCHRCIDNCIHTYAGVQLRNYCADIMRKQGYPEPTGQAKLTPAFNLPSRYIIHTVGPVVNGSLTDRHRELLANCYRACLNLADENGLESIAFCCISTGEFRFPKEEAAAIAIREVRTYHKKGGQCSAIFNVFSDQDFDVYSQRLMPIPSLLER